MDIVTDDRVRADGAETKAIDLLHTDAAPRQPFGMGGERLGPAGLARLCPAQPDHRSWIWDAAKIMIEADDAGHFGAAQVQCLRNLADRGFRHMTEFGLYIVEDRQQRAFAMPMRVDDVFQC